MRSIVLGLNNLNLVTAFTIFLLLSVASNVFADSEDLDFIEAVRTAPTSMKSLPGNQKARRLLSDLNPRVFVSPKSYIPISFYEDYLPNTVLKNSQDRIVEHDVSPSLLSQSKNDPDRYLDYQLSSNQALTLSPGKVAPTMYGEICADTLVVGEDSVPLLFLRYSVVGSSRSSVGRG